MHSLVYTFLWHSTLYLKMSDMLHPVIDTFSLHMAKLMQPTDLHHFTDTISLVGLSFTVALYIHLAFLPYSNLLTSSYLTSQVILPKSIKTSHITHSTVLNMLISLITSLYVTFL